MANRNQGGQDGGTPEEIEARVREMVQADLDRRLAKAREEGARQERERQAAEAREREATAAQERERAANLQREHEARNAEAARAAAEGEAQRQADAQALAEAQAREAERDRWDRTGHRLEVRGPVGGRWRAGRHFTVVPTIIEPGVLTRVEREMIDRDPMLAVRATETE